MARFWKQHWILRVNFGVDFVIYKDCAMRFVGRFWCGKLRRLCLGLVAVSIAVGMIGCGVKSANAKENIGDSSAQETSQNAWQNTAKVTINISSQINGLNKSVLTYWCKAQEKSSQEKSIGDKDDRNSKADMSNSEQNLTPQSTQFSDTSELEFSPNDLKNAQDSTLRDSHKSHSELDSQANSSHTPQNPSKLDTSTPSKCKAIGGANAFFRALKTSRFRAPRDEVVELEAGVYYLAAFEIEAKRHILRSCSEEASKCGGYEEGKPRFLAFRVNSGENLILPKVIILPKTKEANLASDFEDSTKSKEAEKAKKSDKESKKIKRAKKSKNDEPKELIFVILEDFDKQESENLPHKAESKRGNAIFSLGSGVSFEFSTLSDKDDNDEATPNPKNLNQKGNDTSQTNSQSTDSTN